MGRMSPLAGVVSLRGGRSREVPLDPRSIEPEVLPGAMTASDQMPANVGRAWEVIRRFQKFLVVGAIGLGVNQAMLYLLAARGDAPLHVASPVAIFLSMIVTFGLNEVWTWHDRGTGPLLHRVGLYFPINTVGLLINYLVLQALVDFTPLHLLMANLIGAGVAAIWNFSANHSITWRR